MSEHKKRLTAQEMQLSSHNLNRLCAPPKFIKADKQAPGCGHADLDAQPLVRRKKLQR